MTLFDLILIAVSLSMDAFAVSICKGLSVRKVSLQHAMICGVWFGGFQFLMPALGYFLGDRFAALLTKFGPWIAFVLLARFCGERRRLGIIIVFPLAHILLSSIIPWQISPQLFRFWKCWQNR